MSLHHGDCLDIMPTLEAGSIDLVLTDPPYGTTACKWDSVIPLEPMWDNLKRLIKPNGAIVMTASQPFTTTLIGSNMKMFKYCWVWVKNCPSNIACGNYMPLRYSEDVVVFYAKCPVFNKQMIERSASGKAVIESHQKNKTTFKLSRSDVSSHTPTEVDPDKYDSNLKNPSNVIEFKVDRRRAVKHPSKKPVALMEYMIRTYTNAGEMVLDFTMGSGTTGVACVKLGRKFIGIELDPGNFDIAVKRIESAFADGGLFNGKMHGEEQMELEL